jgi:hypothetical protein
MKQTIMLLFVVFLFFMIFSGTTQDKATHTRKVAKIVTSKSKQFAEQKTIYKKNKQSDTQNSSRAVQEIAYEETFAGVSPPPGWLVVDNDGSGSAFSFVQQVTYASVPPDTVNPQAGQSFWFSNFNNANGAGLIDEWLISPKISALSLDSLFFYAGAFDAGFNDSLKVWVSTTGTTVPGDFTEIGYFKVDGPVGSWNQYRFDLSAYSGQDIYVAVNYYIVDGGPVGSNSDNVWVDHFIVTGTPSQQAKLNPPRALQAQTGLEINLNWVPPLPAGELGYDDGSSEATFGFADSGAFAVRFTPNVYPSTLLAIKTYWDSSTTTLPDDDVEYSVWVDTVGGDVAPDSEVIANTAYTIPYRNDWSEVDISSANIVINEGDFFYSWSQIDTLSYQIGLDIGPDGGRTWTSFDDEVTWYKLNALGLPYNAMIHALVQEGTGPNARIVELSPDGRREVNLSAQTSIYDYTFNIAKFIKPYPYKDELFRSAPSISKSTNHHKSDSRASIRALTGYNIYRDSALLTSTDASTTNYIDASVALGTAYTYYVTAVYDEGESDPSNVASATAAGEALMSLNHTPGDLNAGIFNNGFLGTENELYSGPGITWEGVNGLYFGAPIFGASGVDSVNGQYYDFTDLLDLASDFAGGFTSDANFDQISDATIDDRLAPTPYDVEILQKSYSNTGDEFVFLRYGYVNNSGSDLNDFYAGLFFDWDIGDYTTNSGGVSVAENLAYQYDTSAGDTAVYYGAAALDGLSGWEVSSRLPETDEDFRAESFQLISNPDTDPIEAPNDFRSWLGTGPFDIAAGDTHWVTFALVAGDGLDSIRTYAAAASAKAQTLGWIRITAPKVLISEIVTSPTEGEFAEIYNPNDETVDLTNYYFTDATYTGNPPSLYWNIVTGSGYGGGTFGDWNAKFPEGATIGPHEFQTVAFNGDSDFVSLYGVNPTYEIDQAEFASGIPDGIPDMLEAAPGSIFGPDSTHNPGLTNGDEVVILYYWDGTTDLVGDVDYLLYNTASPTPNDEATSKTGVTIDGPDPDTLKSAYLPDTDVSLQRSAPNEYTLGHSTHRIDYSEGNQIQSGGNGVTGGDETSENLDATFTANSVPSPNGPRIPTSVSLQPIHNAAQATLATIDIYVNGVLVGDNWDFRTAQPFIPLLSDVPLNIGVAFSNSTSVNDTIRNFSAVLEPGKDYTAVLSGVLTPVLYADNPDGRSIALDFFDTDNAQKVSSTVGNVDLQVMNGVTDAPKLDVKVAGTPIVLVDNLGYGDFSGYVSLSPDMYTLEVTDSSGSTSYGSFTADLSALADSAITVFASGFLDPSANQNGPALGLFAVFPSGNVVELTNVVGIKENGNLPTTFAISQNYPNPFNPTTSIKYQLPQTADVTITIYNLLGQKVRTLVNDKKEPGYYEVEWNGLNDHDVQVATGLYIYRIKAADFVRSKKMLLLK